jgi:hypothetical protein
MMIDVDLPRPYTKQQAMIDSTAKRIAMFCGRRSGKTTVLHIIAIVKYLLVGKRFFYCAPVDKQTDAFWEACKFALKDMIESGLLKKNEQKKIIKSASYSLPFGEIQAQTGHSPDTLRSGTADGIALDEWAMMQYDVWDKVIAPMVLDTDATVYFATTPRGKNHAYKHTYIPAKTDTTGRWALWHFPSFDNPHLSKDALEEITSDMTAQAYQQEIMAEFLDSEGQVFRNIPANMTSDGRCGCGRGGDVVAGIDWGKLNDFTVISIGCRGCRKELFIDRFNRIDYRLQVKRLVDAINKHNVSYVLAESNSIGEPNIERLFEELPYTRIEGVFMDGFKKTQFIESLAVSLERVEFQFLPDTISQAELEAYEMEMTSTGRPRFNAPSGIHDDTVIAHALMLHAANSYIPAVMA